MIMYYDVKNRQKCIECGANRFTKILLFYCNLSFYVFVLTPIPIMDVNFAGKLDAKHL